MFPKRFIRSCLLLATALPLAVAASSLSEKRVVSADISQVRGPTSRAYKVCVGAGRANEGLRADWQRQLRRVRSECGFTYLRFHGLFCDDMGVYFEDEKGRPIYNWQYVDELFDFLRSIGMKPFVELGFMPGALASGQHTIFWYKANVTPPNDYAKWEALVSAFVRHVTERYGSEEIRSWYFEVWNEPNLPGFWIGTTGGKSDAEFQPVAFAEYRRLYESSVRAVKGVDPLYRIGGPATAGSGWIDEMLSFCAEKKLPLDFVSTHTYATTSGFLDETGKGGTILTRDRGAITGEVINTRAKIAGSAFPNAELHYTEWSASYSPADPVHDSYHSAAFILNKIRHVGNAADSLSYWTFTDIFEEAGPRHSAFHGGFGLLNYQDLPKPSYFAYKFLQRLGDTELVCDDPESFVSLDASGGVQALFWDFTITQPGMPTFNQDFYLQDQPALPKGRAELRLAGLKQGAYRLLATKVGYRANDVQSAWRDLGSPGQLTRTQVGALNAQASGAPLIDEKVEIGADGLFGRSFEQRENDVWLVELQRL